jgi:translation initiation factor 1
MRFALRRKGGSYGTATFRLPAFAKASAGSAHALRAEAERRKHDNRGMSERNARLVYSSAAGRVCPRCGQPERGCRCGEAAAAPVPGRPVAKLRLEKAGRGGKTVTVVFGLPNNAAFLKDLAQDLKRACGTGGAVREDGVELQGDLRDRVRELLTARNFLVKG